jgi:cytochrome P450
MVVDIPGPGGGPVLGMLPAFRRDVLGCTLDSFRRYGDVVAYPFGPRKGPLGRVVVGAYHPDDVHRVLTGTGHGFNRRTVGFDVMTEAFGEGLLTTEGETWLRQRRTLQPLFTPRHVARYAALMADEARRIIADQQVAPGAVVDLHRLMQRYTLRVVGRALFGEDVDEFVDDLYRLVPEITAAIRARVIQVTPLPLTWPTPRNRRFIRLRAAQYAMVDRILARRAPHPFDDYDDLITRLRAARDPETGRPLSLREVRDQALIFLMAGHETTAGALTFTLDLLGRHAEIQDKVAAEEGLVRPALLEGMRLYPPVYVTERKTATDMVLRQHFLPPGTMVLTAPWVTHRHPAFWPDPDRFDPTRFVGDQDRPRYAYFPFGGGPRSCIGEHFAMLEAEVLLKALLDRYRIEAVDRPPQLRAYVTLRPAGAVPARLSPRRGTIDG